MLRVFGAPMTALFGARCLCSSGDCSLRAPMPVLMNIFQAFDNSLFGTSLIPHNNCSLLFAEVGELGEEYLEDSFWGPKSEALA